MDEFLRRHRAFILVVAVFLLMALILIVAGRSIGCFVIDQVSLLKSRDKAVCTINTDNATQIVYKGTTYQILEETVDNSAIGGWSGVFRKVAVLDDRYRVLKQERSAVDSDSQIKQIAKQLPPKSAFVVFYFNAFTIKNVDETSEIAVNLDSGTFKAVPAGTETSTEKPLQFTHEFTHSKTE